MPGILFLCVHNAGRSQMAAGFARRAGAGRIEVFSGGSEPAGAVNPAAVEVMAEVGIDIAGFVPQRFTDDLLARVDVVVTMGCGDTCPVFPGKRYVDWELTDPAGLTVDDVRPIREEIRGRVQTLLGELSVPVV